MKRPRVPVPPSPRAAAALLCLALAACGGGGPAAGGVSVAPPGGALSVDPLELQSLGAPLRPFGLVGEQTVSWRATHAVEYTIELAPAGGGGAVEVLASGALAAFEPVDVTLGADDLAPGGSALRMRAVDALGREAVDTRALQLAPVDTFVLGLGEHVDLAYDATRDELLVANRQTGATLVVDVDPDAASYGQVVGLLPPGPDAGPFALAATPDGRRGYNLNRTTLLGYDLSTLTVEENLFLPGGFEGSSVAATPDSTRVYLGYFHTLLVHELDPQGGPPAVESVGLSDGLVLGGDVALSPDGALALYAWFGESAVRGLWIVDADPSSPDYHALLAEALATAPPATPVGPARPRVAVAPGGAAAWVGDVAGVRRVALDAAAGFPVTGARADLPFSGLAAVEVDGRELAALTAPGGALTVLDDALDTVAQVALPPLLVDRAAWDAARGRLFLVSQQQLAAGRLLVVPLR